MKKAQKLIKRGIVLQLGHVYEDGMPQFPGTHPCVLSALEPVVLNERQMSIGEVLQGSLPTRTRTFSCCGPDLPFHL